MKVVFTPTATRHIESQLEYLVSKGAVSAAIAARERIASFVSDFLVRYPRAGRFIPEREIYEIWIPRTRFVVFYRIERGNVLTILAFFHTSQDRSAFEVDGEI